MQRRIVVWMMSIFLSLSCLLKAQAEPSLQVYQDWLMDEQNRVVIQHGLNVVWKLSPYAPPNEAAGFTSADADWLVRNGFNSVRLGVLFAGVMPQAGVIDQSYLTAMDRIVQLLTSRGIWVLLDMHQDMYNEAYFGEGFPSWAVYNDGIAPSSINLGDPGNFAKPGLQLVYDNFYNNKAGLWNHYAAAAQAIAQRWHNQPYLMGYDIYNEPFPGTAIYSCLLGGCASFDVNALQPLQTFVLRSIRAVDTQHIVWVEPEILFDFGTPSYLGTTASFGDAQLGLSWHNYCATSMAWQEFGITNSSGCVSQESAVFGNAAQTAQRLQSGSLMTEFGASNNAADIAAVTQLADQHLSGWMYWSYKQWADPTGAPNEGLFANDADLGSGYSAKLQVLVRPYPRATAGFPLSLSVDPTAATLNYSYRTNANATGPTEIFLPLARYAHGYSVNVTGARIISAPNAAILQLANLPGAASVSVMVWAQ